MQNRRVRVMSTTQTLARTGDKGLFPSYFPKGRAMTQSLVVLTEWWNYHSAVGSASCANCDTHALCSKTSQTEGCKMGWRALMLWTRDQQRCYIIACIGQTKHKFSSDFWVRCCCSAPRIRGKQKDKSK
eukprot:2011254-Amphidinium_carterae.1